MIARINRKRKKKTNNN
uniref:Uncharacterized protein n=1 Tax=Rhizophora mucronata TaxID=61149 RepID=A0A2P2PQD0_RHIMU